MSPDGKKEESVRTVSVSDNCLGQQDRVRLKVSDKTIGGTAQVVCYFPGYDITYCSTHRYGQLDRKLLVDSLLGKMLFDHKTLF